LSRRLAWLSAAVLLFPSGLWADSNKPRPKIWGIFSVTLSSTDFSAARAFYPKALDQPADQCNWCEQPPYSWKGMFLPSVQRLQFERPADGRSSDHVGLVTFATDDVQGMLKYLEQNKIKIDRVRPKRDFRRELVLDGSDTEMIVFLRDPEGHRIAFIQMPAEVCLSHLHTADLRIVHAGIIVRDVAAEDRFYRDILGFHLYWHGGRTEGKDDWVAMQVPDGTDWVEYMLNIPPNADQRTLGVASHIAVGVTDIRSTQGRLMEDGVKLNEEPVLGLDGKWQINLYDSDKTRIEFMEFAPKAKPCCSEFTGTQPGPQ
jgi:catechol 2,3-dioxygenase-like lactoylglutathione lyase family enzyme